MRSSAMTHDPEDAMAHAVQHYLAARQEFRADGKSDSIRRFAQATDHLCSVFCVGAACRDEMLAVGFDGLRKALADAQDKKQRLSH